MLPDRFWAKVAKSDDCWIWVGARDDVNGYGIFLWENRKTRRAHRLAWEDERGPIPTGLMLCHRCNTPPCVRTNHMYLGTQKDNMRDLVLLGHYNAQKTHCPHGHKYTDENTYVAGRSAITGAPHRGCRACRRANNAQPVLAGCEQGL